MTYQVLARKWRPQQFDDVVGQDHVTQTLKNAIKTSRIAHAYLFVGPRGIGKTSMARIFAKALNCVKGPTVTPCDNCDSCKEIMAGVSLDVLEIDGASNNGVEQVRDLRETVHFLPVRGSYKIIIIDEVHMLSVAAFNALLKTLEEPPPQVMFIFATTEPHKILATIISRCQRFDLRRISVPAIVERLGLIIRAEKVKADEDALLAIARGAEGGLRDAESALDQLISFKGNKISENDVLSVFGIVSRRSLEDLAEKILKGDIRGLLKIVAGLDHDGKDLQRLIIELMEHFRNLLVCLQVGDDTESLDLTEAQSAVLKKQSDLTDSGRVLRFTGILSETEDRMRYALSRRTILETALIRCAHSAIVVSLEEILMEIRDLTSLQQDTISGKLRTGKQRTDNESGNKTSDSPPLPPETETESADELVMLQERWQDVLENVGKIAVLARSSLVDTRPVQIEGDRIVVALDPEFSSEIENLELSRNRKALEHVLDVMLKRAVRVEFRLEEAEVKGRNVEVEKKRSALSEKSMQQRESMKSPSEGVKSSGNGKKLRSREDWVKDPAVQKVLDTFKGDILDVRE